MLIKFNQAVVLKDENGKEKHFKRGTHEVQESFLKSRYFHKLMKSALVEDGKAERSVKPQSLADRQRRLAEKLAKTPTAVPKGPNLEAPPAQKPMAENSVKLAPPDDEAPASDPSMGEDPMPMDETEAPEEAEEESSSKAEEHSKKSKKQSRR